MRLFQTIEEAASEIKRDLAKSPVVKSSRVQNLVKTVDLREALDYSYSVVDIPNEAGFIATFGYQQGFWKADQQATMLVWLERERAARLRWEPGALTELVHPHLNLLMAMPVEGDIRLGEKCLEPDYTYTDRLRGGLDSVAILLSQFPDSRRGYVPIFQQEDMVRASRIVRIPCSLGYQATIRWVNEVPNLHLTYLERACDFNKFWLTDLWLARQWQLDLVRRVKMISSWPGFASLVCGNTTHFITSLHAFIDDEVY